MPVTIPVRPRNLVRKKSTCVDYLLYAMPMPFPSSCAVNHCNNTVIRNFYSLFQNSKHVGSKKLNLKISQIVARPGFKFKSVSKIHINSRILRIEKANPTINKQDEAL